MMWGRPCRRQAGAPPRTPDFRVVRAYPSIVDHTDVSAPSIFTAQLSNEDIDSLRLLLGHGLWQIFSGAIEVEGPVLTVWNLSILLERGRWIVVTNDWIETPVEFLDYFQLRVEVAETPRDIVVRENGALVAPSSILLRPPSPITRISILERMEGDEAGAERVVYDHGFILDRADGVRVCIAAARTIAAQLEVTTDPAAVHRIMEGCRLRTVVEHAA
jgi:hypothetical protein